MVKKVKLDLNEVYSWVVREWVAQQYKWKLFEGCKTPDDVRIVLNTLQDIPITDELERVAIEYVMERVKDVK